MVAHVRNFWIEADIDGRWTALKGGPRSRDGGFSLTVYIRDNGGILRAVEMNGIARSDGTLVVSTNVTSDMARSETGEIAPSGTAGSPGFIVTTKAGYAPCRQPRARTISPDDTTEAADDAAAGRCKNGWSNADPFGRPFA